MKYKRLICMAFALVLIGASVMNATTAFADEADEVVAPETAEVETSNGGGTEADEAEADDTAEATDAAEASDVDDEADEVAPAAEAPVLRAAPLLGAGNDVGDDADDDDEAEPEEEVVVYDIEMLPGDTVTMTVDGVNFNSNQTYRCVITKDGVTTTDLTCGRSGNGQNSRLNGRLTATGSALGVYNVKIERRRMSNNAWVEAGSVTVAVYDLDVTSEQADKLIEAGTEFKYTIADNSGNVTVTAIRKTVQGVGEEAETIENPVEVTDGVVDTTEAGAYEVTFTNQLGQSVTISFNVYSVEAAEPYADGDDYEAAAETLVDFLSEFANVNPDEMTDEEKARFEAIFGDSTDRWYAYNNMMDELGDGGEIVTGVDFYGLDEDSALIGEALAAKMAEYNADEVAYYDIYAWVDVDGFYVGDIHELDGRVTVAIMEVTDPEAGYERTYYVVRQHIDAEGNITIEELAEGDEFYIENGILYINSDRFSTYAVAYKDTLTLKAPDTGAATEETGSASASNSSVMAMVAAVAAIALAGAAVFAKRK